MIRSITLGLFVSLTIQLFCTRGFAQESEAALSYDVGLSTGQVNDVNYTEANLGFNYRFIDYLAWRNSLFGRFGSEIDSVYGIDTSLRGLLGFGDRQLGVSAFFGPGFRFITKGENAPFVEGGVVLSAAGISIGAGAKTIFNSAVRSGAENDAQVFLILAGGGSL